MNIKDEAVSFSDVTANMYLVTERGVCGVARKSVSENLVIVTLVTAAGSFFSISGRPDATVTSRTVEA